MMSMRVVLGVCSVAGLFCLVPSATADTWQLILQGKVVMEDGSPPPQSVGIERVCSDTYGSAPGPLTDKKTGQYVWHMEVDPIGQTRQCTIRATMKGYQSTEINISNFIEQTDPHMIPLVLTPMAGDPNKLILSNDNVPGKASASWKAAIKALDSQNLSEVVNQLKMAVQAAPKFAQGWSVLGVVYVNLNSSAAARDAFEHAIEADPKNASSLRVAGAAVHQGQRLGMRGEDLRRAYQSGFQEGLAGDLPASGRGALLVEGLGRRAGERGKGNFRGSRPPSGGIYFRPDSGGERRCQRRPPTHVEISRTGS